MGGKFNLEVKYRDLHAIKHALEKNVAFKKSCIHHSDSKNPTDTVKQFIIDVPHEEELLKNICSVINSVKN